jgi:hypothetical protein
MPRVIAGSTSQRGSFQELSIADEMRDTPAADYTW